MIKWTICAVALLSLSLAGSANAGLITLGAFMDGSQEVPPVATTATGQTLVIVDDVTGQFDLTLTAAGLTLADLTGAHIHLGAPDENGPAIYDLDITQFIGAGLLVGRFINDGTFPAQYLDDLINGNTYVNLHTTAWEDGFIRGQLIANPLPEPLSMSLLAAGGVVLTLRRRSR